MKRVLRESNLPNIAAVSAENPLGLSLPSWKVVKYVKDACSVGFVKVKPERDEEQASAAEEALTNDVILSEIFKNVSTKDLLKCRSVKQKWNSVACAALKSRKLYINNVKMLDRCADDPFTDPISSLVAKNFEKLIQCIENSENFPFVGVNFSGWYWKVSNSNVKKFFRLFGTKVRRLVLDSNFQSSASIIELLVKFMPNVEYLEVKEVGNFSRMQSTANLLHMKGKRICLPSLKVLVIHYDGSSRFGAGKQAFCSEVIFAAPRLQTIENFHCSLMKALVKSGKIYAASSLYFTPDIIRDGSHCKQFLQGACQIKTLVIDRCIEAVNYTEREVHGFSDDLFALLSASSNTLEHLKTNPLAIVKGSRFPVMKVLKSLHITHDIGRMRNVSPANILNSYRIFLDAKDIEACFPALERVRLELATGAFSFLYRYFGNPYFDENMTIFPTVKILELACQLDVNSIMEMAKIFPNVTHVRIDWAKCFQASNSVPTIWRLPSSVEKLDIHGFRIPWDRNGVINNGVALDSFFTGIPEDICLNLRAAPMQAIDPVLLRTLPSIVNLKNLKELNISFSYKGMLAVRLLTHCPLISPLTGWYGFRTLPALKVRFLFDFHHPLASDMESALKPACMYVSFDHQDEDKPF